MTTVALANAFADWAAYEHAADAAQRIYVAGELRRLDKIGAALLTTCVAQLDDRVKHLALTLLKRNDDGDGKPIYERGRQWSLRLVEGEAPPTRDAQGRPLPPDVRGKVLRTKVANLGGNLGTEADPRELARYSAQQRQARDRSGQDLYVQVDVSRTAQPFSIEDALSILSQWGVGVAARQYKRHPQWRPNAENDEALRGQCQWLVEEIVPSRADDTRTDDARPTRSKAA